jgi:hypothetical protein
MQRKRFATGNAASLSDARWFLLNLLPRLDHVSRGLSEPTFAPLVVLHIAE